MSTVFPELAFPRPSRLEQVCDVLARRFSTMSAPADFDYGDLVERFHRGEELSSKDRSRLPWALPAGDPPLLARDCFSKALYLMEEQLERGRAKHLHGAIYCFTNLGPEWTDEARELGDWIRKNLKKFGARFSSLEHWARHERLFGNEGEEYLAEVLLEADPYEAGFREIRVQPHCWLAVSAMKCLFHWLALEPSQDRVQLFELAEEQYRAHVPDFVGMMLARIREEDDWRRRVPDIEAFFLKHLGHPSMDRRGHWQIVPREALEVARKWVTEKNIRLFYDHLVKSGDKHRLHFWLEYLDRVDDCRILVGSNDSYSTNKEIRTAINSGEIGRLDGPSDVSAFFMKIGRWWIIEFSQIGNATYAYTQDRVPFKPWGARSYSIHTLKKSRSHRVIHPRGTYGAATWREEFYYRLQQALNDEFPPPDSWRRR